MTTWLVTGGAGSIGNHVTRALLASGRKVVVLDDLSSGHADRIPAGVAFVEANVTDRQSVVAALTEHHVDGVIHLAAKKAAGESVDVPLYYYRENVAGMLSLMEAMQEAGVKRLVYSSSAAVYGTRLLKQPSLLRNRRMAKPKWWASGWRSPKASPTVCHGSL